MNAAPFTTAVGARNHRSLRRATPIPVQPFEYYRVRCAVRSDQPVLHAFQFFDRHGRELVSDDYCVFDPAPIWAPRERFTHVREDATSLRFVVRPDHGPQRVREVSITRASAADVLAWSDRLAATLPAVTHRPPRDRWRHLRLTRQRLRTGHDLRLLVLGDSIANDISNSQFHLLIQRMYPGALITLLRSVRAARGCSLFQHRVRNLIAAKQPDLVLIGGISHRCDAAAVARVVTETRRQTGRPVEFLVTTSALCDLGQINWRRSRSAGRSHERQRVESRDRSRALAATGEAASPGQAAERRFYETLLARREELRIAVFDLRTAWEAYLAASGQPRGWFQRDSLHANARGKNALGRMIARYLDPTTR